MGPYVAAAASVNATTTLNGSTGTINVAPDASITIVMSVTTNGVGTNDDWNSSRWAFGTTAPAAASMTCVDHPNHTVAGTYTETFTITAPASAGNWNLYLYAYNGDACASGQGALFTRVGAIVVARTGTGAMYVLLPPFPSRPPPFRAGYPFPLPFTSYQTCSGHP